MLPEELKLFLRKCKNKVFIYAWEYFTRRIHDELVRSVIEESPFSYVEINFSVVQQELPSNSDRLKFWEAFFEELPKQKRFCDLCGFLRNDEGIAFLFVNSIDNNPAWDRFCSEIEAKTSFDMRKWEGLLYADYPPKEFFNT
ncbi:MAG: hypothetical protein FWB90_00385 [Fibromonadales bacterium]|nr:hypothetical protein [Fibromonadales bacterium]